MKQRILTGLILAPLAIAIILLSPTPLFAVITGIAWLLSAWEWTRLIEMRSLAQRAAAVLVVALALLGLWFVRGSEGWWLVIGMGVAWWLIAFLWLRNFAFAASPTSGNRARKMLAGLFVLIPSWTALIEIHSHPDLGPSWTLLALIIVWAADTFAYFAGSRFGKTKLAPRVSPGKTIEGVWGALIGTGIVIAIGGWFLDERGWPLALLIVLALMAVIFSIVGDLFESLIKRQANVKDSGTLFPGHGGLLDRLDGVFAAMPLFAIGKTLIDLLFPT
jgi:phosphatidate cytidylyltransferase